MANRYVNPIRKQIMAWAATTIGPFTRDDVVAGLRKSGSTASELTIKNAVSICVAMGNLRTVYKGGGAKGNVAKYDLR